MKFQWFKKNRFLLLPCIAVLAFGLIFTACDLQTTDDADDAANNLQLTMTGDGLMDSVTGGTGSTVSGSTSVPVEANVSVAFDADIDPSTLTAATFKVTRVDTSEVLAGTVSYANRVATFTPSRVFVCDTVNKTTIRKGLKQDTSYTVTIAAPSIKSTSGAAQGTANYTFTFKTVPLDYGIFFLGSNGEYQKALAGTANPYFDKTKPTVVYFHGWQSGSTKSDFCQDNAFFFNSSIVGSYNAAASWRSKGYNVCIVYWAQFADEGEVKDAQAKMWLGANGKKNMRYMLRSGSYAQFATDKSVTDLIFAQYMGIFSGYTGGYIRFMGHSLGNQFATLLAYKISTGVAAGTVSSSLMPKRISLLDPFWGKGSETYCGKVYPGAKCVTYMKEMLARNAFALEEIRTNSNIGYWVGDSCVDMRKLAAYVCAWPSFTSDDTAKHCYSYNWYALSIDKLIYADKAPGSAGLGAAAGDDQIKAAMNWDFAAKAVKSTQYVYNISAGAGTVTPTDDSFKQASGVN